VNARSSLIRAIKNCFSLLRQDQGTDRRSFDDSGFKRSSFLSRPFLKENDPHLKAVYHFDIVGLGLTGVDREW
jgi:hypothetical protein